MGYFTTYRPISVIRTGIIAGIACLCLQLLHAQNQPLADSLESAYLKGGSQGAARLELLDKMIKQQTNPEKALSYSDTLLKTADSLHLQEYQYEGFLNKGNALILMGNLSEALQAYFSAVKIAQATPGSDLLAKVYIAIAAVYSAMGDRQNTIQYYKNAIDLLKDKSDSLLYATALENLGDEYNINMSKPDSALLFFEESGPIWKALKHEQGMAYNLGNTGLAYAQLGRNEEAEGKIGDAISRLDALKDYYPISVYLTYMADIYADMGDWDAAFTYALRSLKLARQYGLKEQISNAYLKLSQLYEKTGYTGASLKYYRSYIAFRDSVRNIATVQQMADMRRKNEVAQKQAEVDLLNQERKTQRILVISVITALFLIGLLAFGLYRRNRFIKATNEIIEREMDTSDALLRNILPEATARELKTNGKVTAKYFESVTVLFTDFKGFTKYSETLSPQDLVNTVDYYFSNFDAIIQKYGLEKIKTIGDAYMCAGGLPYPEADHAVKTVTAALEILDFVNSVKENPPTHISSSFEVRIGINSGPVVAGVVGTKKFAYDIWGDTVNIASRMESGSVAGRINISEPVYELVKGHFICNYRGKIEVKNKGTMKMYFVNGIKNRGVASQSGNEMARES